MGGLGGSSLGCWVMEFPEVHTSVVRGDRNSLRAIFRLSG